MARIGIVGAARALYIGSFLHLSGCQVAYVVSDSLRDEVTAAERILVSDRKDRRFEVPAEECQLLTDVAELAAEDVSLDFLIVSVKACATERLAESLKHMDGKVVIVSLQNGVDNTETLRRILPNTTVIAGMLPFNVAHLPNAHFHQASVGPVFLEDCEEASTLAQILIEAGMNTQLSGNMTGLLYGKHLLTLVNAIAALAGASLQEILADRTYRSGVLARCISEGLA
ncbi:ketopantoate reductase PanE/ApbA-domain-containing protein, partial [Blyttiomyces helicus]